MADRVVRWIMLLLIGYCGLILIGCTAACLVFPFTRGPLWALSFAPLLALVVAAAAWMFLDVWRDGRP